MTSGYYDITSKTLGKGHYGVVKLGRHCLTGEPVAIKIIEKSRLNHDSLNQLGTEIRILFRLSEYEHPNILKLYQTIDTDDKLFLVTEYCGPHACDLHDYLSRKHRREGLSEREAQVFFIQICSAISYCHSMGIVHRDLKPENILVTDYKHMHGTSMENDERLSPQEQQYPLLKLIDFGFANQWYPDEKMRTSCGTLAYSAPELLMGEPYDGTKVDVWGLGLMLYILLYGGNPFMQINDNETLTKILDCSFCTPIRDHIDFSAVDLLRSLIKRDPDTRLPMDAILKHKWFSNSPQTVNVMRKYHKGNDKQSHSSRQATKVPPQVVSPTLPSINECGPLRSLNRSADDDQVSRSFSETPKPYYIRARSLSITRSHQRLGQQSSLPLTKSSVNLDKSIQSGQCITPPMPINLSQIYRPTSPDVGGQVKLTEEENKLHESVIQEVFNLTKFIESGSSIEASLKSARFAHRLFNQTSIKPAQLAKNKSPGSLVKSLLHGIGTAAGHERTSGEDKVVDSANKLHAINNKLSNDDYIYATYQLTRDRILRVRKEKGKPSDKTKDPVLNQAPDQANLIMDEKIPTDGQSMNSAGEDGGVHSKENGKSRRQRKLLQPQHKMRDKFTSFFRSGSTSPNSSFRIGGDSSQDSELSPNPGPSTEIHHDAFNDQHNEMSSSTHPYFSIKPDSQENPMSYALPLARKCSLVNEESGCSTDISDH